MKNEALSFIFCFAFITHINSHFIYTWERCERQTITKIEINKKEKQISMLQNKQKWQETKIRKYCIHCCWCFCRFSECHKRMNCYFSGIYFEYPFFHLPMFHCLCLHSVCLCMVNIPQLFSSLSTFRFFRSFGHWPLPSIVCH